MSLSSSSFMTYTSLNASASESIWKARLLLLPSISSAPALGGLTLFRSFSIELMSISERSLRFSWANSESVPWIFLRSRRCLAPSSSTISFRSSLLSSFSYELSRACCDCFIFDMKVLSLLRFCFDRFVFFIDS